MRIQVLDEYVRKLEERIIVLEEEKTRILELSERIEVVEKRFDVDPSDKPSKIRRRSK